MKADPELSQQISAMIASLRDFPNPTLVVGEGWAAMASVGFAATNADESAPKKNILWILNSGTHAMSPLPFVEAGVAADAWKLLAHRLGVTNDEPQAGHYLREFRNRSFARPPWHKSPTREMRIETRMEWLWAPETRIAPVFESRFEWSIGELEEKIREKLTTLPNVRILSDVPVTGFEAAGDLEGDLPKVIIATGEKIPFSTGIWADRWIGLGAIEGLPKNSGLARNREPMGILQAVFTHSGAMVQQSMQEAFFTTTHKDAGEDFSRAVWGYFFDGGKKSVWSLFLTEDEGADNHIIGKKYRRMKQAIEKMFTGPEWLPEGAKDFFSTVENEHFAFQEDFIFANGEVVTEPQYVFDLKKVGKQSKKAKAAAESTDTVKETGSIPLAFVTDAFGPSAALEQVARLYADEIGMNFEQLSVSPLPRAVLSVGEVASTEESGPEAKDKSADPSATSGEET